MRLLTNRLLKKTAKKLLPIIAVSVALLPKIAMAATQNFDDMSAVTQLTALQKTISGPILSAIAVIMVVVTSLMLAFGEWGDGFKRLIQIVFWISIAAGASSMIGNMIG